MARYETCPECAGREQKCATCGGFGIVGIGEQHGRPEPVRLDAMMVPVGTRVRCTYRADHVGTVVALDDPGVWAESLAFPEKSPDPVAVSDHVRKCLLQGLLTDKVPVRWDFGKVYWERASALFEEMCDCIPCACEDDAP